MPYPTGHRTEVKKKKTSFRARESFSIANGFENVSVQQIMAGAGPDPRRFLQLFQKAKAICTPKCWDASSPTRNGRAAGRACTVDLSSTDVGPASRSRRISLGSIFEDVENSCPMVALPSDVARSGKNVKRAYETVFKAMVSILERSVAKEKILRVAPRARAIAAFVRRRHGCRAVFGGRHSRR